MEVERLNLGVRNAAGLNKKDARLMHIVPAEPQGIRPSRYNIPVIDGNRRGIAKFTLFEDKLTLKHLEFNAKDGLVEKSFMRFNGSAEFLAEKLSDLYKSAKLRK